MMRKIKILFLLMTATLAMSAQEKLFTLEDLNFGGNNYRNLQPENMWLTWWGDLLVQTDVEECNLIDIKTGKKKLLFTLDDINKWADSNEEENRYVRHLMNATFPYADKPLVLVGNKKAVLLVDFKKHVIVWQDSISLWLMPMERSTSSLPTAVVVWCMVLPYTETSSASTKEPSGVLTVSVWHSTVWTSQW